MQSGPHNTSAASPLLNEVLERKRLLHQSQSKWKWALLNSFGATLLILDSYGYISFQSLLVDSRSSWGPSLSKLEILGAVILMTNAIIDLLHYFLPYLKVPSIRSNDGCFEVARKDLVLTPKQMKLFNIGNNDPGFKVSTPSKPKEGDKEKHPFGFSPPLEGSFIAASTPGYGVTSFGNSPYYHKQNSPQYQGNQTPASSPASVSTRVQPKFKSSVTENGAISDQSDLQIFLKEYDEWEEGIAHTRAAGSSKMSGMYSGTVQ